jgi:hypothetical protein
VTRSADQITHFRGHILISCQTIGLPDTVPQDGLERGHYQYREKFWTCGFFPGSLYLLLERLIRHPTRLGVPDTIRDQLRLNLHGICQEWAAMIEWMCERSDTHDLGFLIQPAFKRQWQLFKDQKSLSVLHRAARSLASRNNDTLNAIRSWDKTGNKRFAYSKESGDFLVIVDSLCSTQHVLMFTTRESPVLMSRQILTSCFLLDTT